jgi:phosphatidylglycerol lysyltransferase
MESAIMSAPSTARTISIRQSRTALLAPASHSLPADDLAGHFAARYGRAYDAYLVTEPGWEHFWSSQRRGMIAVARHGRYVFSGGGLLAPAAHQEELLRQFVEHAAHQGLTPTFFNICEDQLPLFRKFGFQATKWGEEAVIDLPNCTWSGGTYEWVRRQTNYCRRQGLAVTECLPARHSGSQWKRLMAELVEVSRLFLAAKPHAREMRLLHGAFDPSRLGQKRIFVARRQESGRIEGFVACNPCGGRTWVMETYRQRPDAVRGTTAFIMHQAMRQFQAEGALRASLCLVPGLRCQARLPGDSAMVRWGLAIGTCGFNPAYETAGAHHFKTRFRPQFESRYLCSRPRMTLGTAIAFIRLLGVMDLDLRKLASLAWNRWRKRAMRTTMQQA